jgi:hypothetical protein
LKSELFQALAATALAEEAAEDIRVKDIRVKDIQVKDVQVRAIPAEDLVKVTTDMVTAVMIVRRMASLIADANEPGS